MKTGLKFKQLGLEGNVTKYSLVQADDRVHHVVTEKTHHVAKEKTQTINRTRFINHLHPGILLHACFNTRSIQSIHQHLNIKSTYQHYINFKIIFYLRN